MNSDIALKDLAESTKEFEYSVYRWDGDFGKWLRLCFDASLEVVTRDEAKAEKLYEWALQHTKAAMVQTTITHSSKVLKEGKPNDKETA